jgi:hypothetical protein
MAAKFFLDAPFQSSQPPHCPSRRSCEKTEGARLGRKDLNHPTHCRGWDLLLGASTKYE